MPIYNPGAPGVTFTELLGHEGHTAPSADAWGDWDISAIVPSGTLCVLVQLQNINANPRSAGARKKGTALDRREVIPGNSVRDITTEVDSTRSIQIYSAGLAGYVEFGVLGYWS